MQYNDGKDSFLGPLLVLPVELWKGISGCLGALHGEQSLTVLNRCGMLVFNKNIIWNVIKVMISTSK